MSNLTLVIGSKPFSSWSLRPWLALKQAALPFEEVVIALRQPDTALRIRALSPSGKVPLLRHGSLQVWDSLAICEYVAELACAYPLWPEDSAARAVARAVSAEMHAGFSALRQHLPMAVGTSIADFVPPAAAAAAIARIESLWQECRQRFGAGGDFMFGRWSLADAMYAPVIFRLQSYRIALQPASRAYVDAMLALPAMRQWAAESHAAGGQNPA